MQCPNPQCNRIDTVIPKPGQVNAYVCTHCGAQFEINLRAQGLAPNVVHNPVFNPSPTPKDTGYMPVGDTDTDTDFGFAREPVYAIGNMDGPPTRQSAAARSHTPSPAGQANYDFATDSRENYESLENFKKGGTAARSRAPSPAAPPFYDFGANNQADYEVTPAQQTYESLEQFQAGASAVTQQPRPQTPPRVMSGELVYTSNGQPMALPRVEQTYGDPEAIRRAKNSKARPALPPMNGAHGIITQQPKKQPSVDDPVYSSLGYFPSGSDGDIDWNQCCLIHCGCFSALCACPKGSCGCWPTWGTGPIRQWWQGCVDAGAACCAGCGHRKMRLYLNNPVPNSSCLSSFFCCGPNTPTRVQQFPLTGQDEQEVYLTPTTQVNQLSCCQSVVLCFACVAWSREAKIDWLNNPNISPREKQGRVRIGVLIVDGLIAGIVAALGAAIFFMPGVNNPNSEPRAQQNQGNSSVSTVSTVSPTGATTTRIPPPTLGTTTRTTTRTSTTTSVSVSASSSTSTTHGQTTTTTTTTVITTNPTTGEPTSTTTITSTSTSTSRTSTPTTSTTVSSTADITTTSTTPAPPTTTPTTITSTSSSTSTSTTSTTTSTTTTTVPTTTGFVVVTSTTTTTPATSTTPATTTTTTFVTVPASTTTTTLPPTLGPTTTNQFCIICKSSFCTNNPGHSSCARCQAPPCV